MSGPGVQLRDFVGGPEGIDLVPGDDDLVLGVGAVEPLTVGEVPIPPDLVEEMAAPRRIRSVRYRSGGRVTSPLRSKQRARFQVGWTTLDDEQRETLLAFFRDEVGGTRYGFDVRVDGPGTDSLVTLRAVADPEHVLRAKGVHGVTVFEAEELFT